MKEQAIAERFREFLRSKSLRLTPQRESILRRAYAAHDHFSAETLYRWLQEEDDDETVSRATVYRTLQLLLEGEFIEGLDTGRGEFVYETVLGQKHHDHMVCLACGRIEEFEDERIEKLQLEAAQNKGFSLVSHTLRLMGYCSDCREGAGSA